MTTENNNEILPTFDRVAENAYIAGYMGCFLKINRTAQGAVVVQECDEEGITFGDSTIIASPDKLDSLMVGWYKQVEGYSESRKAMDNYLALQIQESWENLEAMMGVQEET